MERSRSLTASPVFNAPPLTRSATAPKNYWARARSLTQVFGQKRDSKSRPGSPTLSPSKKVVPSGTIDMAHKAVSAWARRSSSTASVEFDISPSKSAELSDQANFLSSALKRLQAQVWIVPCHTIKWPSYLTPRLFRSIRIMRRL